MATKELKKELGAARAEGRHIDLQNAYLVGEDLRGIDLRGANLSGADLCNADLFGAKLSRVNLSGADLSGADLRCAYITDADLSGADLRCANLSWAYLSRAYLSRADLRGAHMENTIGNGREVKTLQTSIWTVTYTADDMQIGCMRYPIAEWWTFDDERIRKMHPKALGWWKRWRPILQMITNEEEC